MESSDWVALVATYCQNISLCWNLEVSETFTAVKSTRGSLCAKTSTFCDLFFCIVGRCGLTAHRPTVRALETLCAWNREARARQYTTLVILVLSTQCTVTTESACCRDHTRLLRVVRKHRTRGLPAYVT